MDMTPFNYLVDMASGQVTAILDWDSAKYLPVGHNLHFIEHLFGYVTRDGWEDVEDREALESYFYDRVQQRLLLQGFDVNDLEALEHEKTLGTLMYYVPRLLEWKDGIAERYLERHLQGRMTDFTPLPRESLEKSLRARLFYRWVQESVHERGEDDKSRLEDVAVGHQALIGSSWSNMTVDCFSKRGHWNVER